jgi:hypothetical protein
LDPDLISPKLSLGTLIDLAREISASDVVIPASYLALLELSIKQRKMTAAFYSPDTEVSEDNKAHLPRTPRSLKFSRTPKRNAQNQKVIYLATFAGL